MVGVRACSVASLANLRNMLGGGAADNAVAGIGSLVHSERGFVYDSGRRFHPAATQGRAMIADLPNN